MTINNKHITRKRITSWTLFLIIIVASGCNPDPRETELRLVIENFYRVETSSRLNLDDSQLASVATGAVLESMLSTIKALKKSSHIPGSDVTLESGITILQYTEDYAVVETLVVENHFSQDKVTGERGYYSETSTPVQMVLVKEDGRWKVKEISLVDRVFD